MSRLHYFMSPCSSAASSYLVTIVSTRKPHTNTYKAGGAGGLGYNLVEIFKNANAVHNYILEIGAAPRPFDFFLLVSSPSRSLPL